MKKYLILLLVTISTLATAQRPVKRFIENQTDSHVNILLNAGAENGTVGAVASVASDLSISTNAGYGVRSFEWSPAGASRNIAFSNGATPLSLRGKSCLAKAEYAGTNFAAGEIVIRVEDNGTPITADLDLAPTASDSTFQKVEIAFICPNTGTNLSIKLVNTVSGKTIWLDQLWLGNDYRLGIEPPKVTGLTEYALSGSDFTGFTSLTLTNGYFNYKRIGDNLHVDIGLIVTGTGTSGTDFTIILSNILSGLTIKTGVYGSGYTRRSASAAVGDKESEMISIVSEGDEFVRFSANGGATNLTGFNMGNATIGDYDKITVSAMLPIVEWQGQGTTETVTLETQGWFAEGEIFGSTAISLVLGNQTSWAEATRSDLTLDLSPNSKPAQIACASGNPSTGTTCSVGNETMGVTVSIPRAGLYEACFNINQSSRASSAIRTVWAVHETEETSTTILQEGLKKVYFGDGNTGTETRSLSGEPCGVFNFTAGRHTIRAMYMQQGSGVNTASIVVDRSPTIGGRNLSFKIIPYTQNFPQAVALPTTRYERKFQATNVTTNTTFMQFTGLISGKTYRYNVKACYRVNDGVVDPQLILNINHDAVSISSFDTVMRGGGTSNERGCFSGSDIFIATSSTLDIVSSNASANSYFIGGSNQTFATIEELGHHTATTDF